jgi:Na+-transporting NADH:ubiquinone oxidoreductase subunit F
MVILMTVISISLISSALAVLIIIAEKYLNHYGECSLDINNGSRILKVEGGSSLLSSLSSQNIFIPSACGGKATCGLCKVQVLEGAGSLLPTEEPYLTKEEIGQNVRLSCQIKVKKDMKLLIPEELFNIRKFRARIEKITTMTHDIREYRFTLLDPEEISFKAGQYVQIYTKPYDKVRESVYRAYSMSSVPSDSKAVELIIRLVPGGICTTYMHTQVKEGDEITLSGPYGDFHLHEGADELVLIAGGSGLAPIRSMVLDILEKGLDKKMTFFFGAVSKKDLYYIEFFQALEEQYENFKFIPALSKPASEDRWEGDTGLITEVVDRYVKDAVNKQAYLCGSPGMINACLQVLDKKGFGNDCIFYDKF